MQKNLVHNIRRPNAGLQITIAQIIFHFLWDPWTHCGIFENGAAPCGAFCGIGYQTQTKVIELTENVYAKGRKQCCKLHYSS